MTFVRIGLSDVTNTSVGISQQVKRPISTNPHLNVQHESKEVSRSSLRRRRTEGGDEEMKPHAKKMSISSSFHVQEQYVENELYVNEYANDISRHLHKNQEQYKCEVNYMKKQTDINEKMRSILVDWLIEVHLKFKASARTLYLAVNLIDRFLSIQEIPRKKLQLVGITCLMIAAKYEEIYPPEITDFVYITDQAYDREDMMEMEITILNALEFNLTVSTPWIFLERYLMVDGAEQDSLRWKIAMFCLDMTLAEYHFIKHDANVIAASALYLTNRLFALAEMRNEPSWGQVVASASGCTESSIRECTKEILTLVCQMNVSATQAVRKKYTRLDGGLVINSKPIQHILKCHR